MNTIKIPSAEDIESRRNRTAILISALGAAFFACSAWGYDFVLLSIAHGVMPWIKFVAGMFISIVSGGFCGYLSVKTSKLAVIMFYWLIWGFFISWITSLLPFGFQEYVLKTFVPLLSGEIDYPLENQGTRLFLAWLIVIALSMIISFLYPNLVDSVLANIHPGATIIFVLLWSALFVVMGKSLDTVYNQPLRKAVLLTHETIQEAREYRDVLDNGKEASNHKILAMRPLKDLLDRPYTLVVKSYDQTIEQIKIIADFDGFWYTCDVGPTLVYNCK